MFFTIEQEAAMKDKYDVLIIGGCSAGLYFAEKIAEQGYDVLVVEKDDESEVGDRYDIFHIEKKTFAEFEIAEPQNGDPEFVTTFNRVISRSAKDKYPKAVSNDVFVMHRHEFMNKLKSSAISKGVEVIYNAKFVSPIFDNDMVLAGGKIIQNEKDFEIHARLTVDASGIPSVVRTSLPDGYGVENFKIGSRDKFYVVLYYVKLDNPNKDRVTETCGWPYYKTWIAPQQDKDGAILGVGANLSYDYAEKCFARFTQNAKLPEYTLSYIEKGCTPYRRPPYSFVGDCFIVLGDAACLTNPWSGEGTTAAWVHAKIAAEIAGTALKNDTFVSKETLWEINKKYYEGQGAEFAQNLSLLPAVVGCTPEENDYEFEKSIIFKGDDDKDNGNIMIDILKGVFAGRMKLSTLIDILKAASIGKKIFTHYRRYPRNFSGFDEWVNKANKLWAKTNSMANLAEKDPLSK